jgi:hypothetical protein
MPALDAGIFSADEKMASTQFVIPAQAGIFPTPMGFRLSPE